MNFWKSKFLVFIVGFILLCIPLMIGWQLLNAQIADDLRATTSRELQLLSQLFTQEANESQEELEKLLYDFAKEGVRISFIDNAGLVLFDSALTPEELAVLDNHATREEIREAQAFGQSSSSRYSSTLESDLVYAATKVSQTKVFPEGTLRIAVPLKLTLQSISSLIRNFFVVFVIFLIGAIVLNYYLYRRFVLSLSQIQRVVENVALPDAKDKLALPRKEEFAELAIAVSDMAQRVEEQFQINASQSSELESIFNTIQAGVMVLDERGYILKLNSAFSKLLPDYFPKELTSYQGKSVLGVLNDSNVSETIHAMYKSESTFESMEVQLSGQIFQLSIVKPEQPENIRVELALVLVFHDITSLAQLVQIKRDLVANVSHELRTPLTAIQGYTETLQTLFKESEVKRQQVEHFLGTIMKNARHLDRIVIDLLSLSSVENLEVENAENIQTSLGGALSMALEECQTLLDSKKIKLENNLLVDTVVNADSDRLSQVFRNLIENAIRYSSEGNTIVLHSELMQSEGNGHPKEECIVYVQDFGPGIPQQELTRVFERFYRVEKHRSDTLSTGLGLSICKHIIEKYHGTINALHHAMNFSSDKSAQVGATIRFTLPVYSTK